MEHAINHYKNFRNSNNSDEYKQYSVILPEETINKLKEICLLDKRSQPKEIEWLIDEKYEELKR